MNSLKMLPLLVFLAFPYFAGAKEKPPVGVPVDAKHFNGKWYRVYLEQTTWKRAKEACERRGGQLVVVHDAATWAFVKEFSQELNLWLGATDEDVEGLWKWVDGKAMTFKAWNRGEPTNGAGKQHYLHIWENGWNDLAYDEKTPRWRPVGYICEWPNR